MDFDSTIAPRLWEDITRFLDIRNLVNHHLENVSSVCLSSAEEKQKILIQLYIMIIKFLKP